MGYVHDSLSPVPLLRLFKYDAGVLSGVLLHFLDAIGNPTGVYIIPKLLQSGSMRNLLLCSHVFIQDREARADHSRMCVSFRALPTALLNLLLGECIR